MKLACETCPWWTRDTTHPMEIGVCHRWERDQDERDQSRYANWWCSLHPAAPKPVYEMVTLHPSTKPEQIPDGFEPVSIAGTNEDWGIVCRRIIGYTKGGE